MEIVFVLGIIIIAFVGILTLIIANIVGSDVSKTRIVASNLAREGIEVVRQIRDSNWLAYNDWDLGLEGLNDDYTAIAFFDEEGTYEWQLDFTPDSLTDDNTVLFLDATKGLYRQKVDYDLGGMPTFYRRLITLNEICRDLTIKTSGEKCEGILEIPKIGIQVLSEVIWTEREREHSVVIEDRLYNWR